MIETERKKEMGDGERKAKTPQRRIEGAMSVARSSNNRKVGFSGVLNLDVPSREGERASVLPSPSVHGSRLGMC